jgi:hypothetical protein
MIAFVGRSISSCKEHQRCFNPSYSNTTKETSSMEELERKNNGGYQQTTPRSKFNRFPLFRGGIDWWRLYI